MTNIERRDFSDPLKHLFSLDFGRTSPPLDSVSQDNLLKNPKQIRKVRFADPQVQEESDSVSPGVPLKELKGILKNKQPLDESDLARSILTTGNAYEEDYSEDFSSSDDAADDVLDDGMNYFSAHDGKELILPEISKDVEPFGVQNNKTTDAQEMSEKNVDSFECDNMKLENDKNNTTTLNEQQAEKREEEPKQDTNFFDCGNRENLERVKGTKIQTLYCKSLKNSYNLLQQSPSKLKCDVKTVRKGVKKYSFSNKPKLHFCIMSMWNNETQLFEQKIHNVDSSSNRYNLPYMKPDVKTLTSDKLMSSDMDWLTQQSMKLRQFLSEDTQIILSAKELRFRAFNAWCKIKNEEKLVTLEKNVPGDEKSKVDRAAEAFMHWKQKKENMRKKKQNETKFFKEATSSSDSVSKKDMKNDDEKNVVYNSWKEKKDRELKMQYEKERRQAKMEKINFFKAKEAQKQDAVLAFNAWKEVKLRAQEEQKQLMQYKSEALRQKLEEKAERSKESQEAYLLWLQQKDHERKNINLFRSKPPWNPPG